MADEEDHGEEWLERRMWPLTLLFRPWTPGDAAGLGAIVGALIPLLMLILGDRSPETPPVAFLLLLPGNLLRFGLGFVLGGLLGFVLGKSLLRR